MLKNIFDSCVGCLGFWLIGYGIGYGNMGYGGFLGTNPDYYAGSKFIYYE